MKRPTRSTTPPRRRIVASPICPGGNHGRCSRNEDHRFIEEKLGRRRARGPEARGHEPAWHHGVRGHQPEGEGHRRQDRRVPRDDGSHVRPGVIASVAYLCWQRFRHPQEEDSGADQCHDRHRLQRDDEAERFHEHTRDEGADYAPHGGGENAEERVEPPLVPGEVRADGRDGHCFDARADAVQPLNGDECGRFVGERAQENANRQGEERDREDRFAPEPVAETPASAATGITRPGRKRTMAPTLFSVPRRCLM